jgi:hypothetical protein
MVAFLVACEPQGDSPGCPSYRMVAACGRWVLGALRTLQLMAGGTLRRHGLGLHGGDLPGQPWIPGQRFAAFGHEGPTVAGLPRSAGQTRRSGSDDAVAYRAPIALSRKASASTPRSLPANPARHLLVEPQETSPARRRASDGAVVTRPLGLQHLDREDHVAADSWVVHVRGRDVDVSAEKPSSSRDRRLIRGVSVHSKLGHHG